MATNIEGGYYKEGGHFREGGHHRRHPYQTREAIIGGVHSERGN